ncbi:MAG: type II toxin-antitoxin system VapC family toxin [Campylobacterota bacterium]|nr:type II toxin-antitoxin system VapC family toxin [Campylobacterota bacterium]
MEYFDINIYIYAFCNNIDDKNQKEISKKLIRESIKNNTIVVSEMILYEFSFVSKKLKENDSFIEENLNLLSQFIRPTDFSINQRVVKILNTSKQYNSSFDIFHLAFCEYNNCKLITFDKGFKKLQNISKTEIIIK